MAGAVDDSTTNIVVVIIIIIIIIIITNYAKTSLGKTKQKTQYNNKSNRPKRLIRPSVRPSIS